jgi:hypothetical protein
MLNKNDYTEIERSMLLEIARMQARIAVFMQAMAVMAKKDAAFAQATVKASDNAALNVRWEDLSRAKLN